MKTSDQIELISKSVSIAQGEMNPASKTTVNPFFKSTFATLTQVWDAIREPLSKNNLSIFQDVVTTPNGIAVSTRVCHSSGQWIEFGPLEITLVKKDAQSLGSATSYAKRYALCAAIGVVADEDDDGERAMNRSVKKQEVIETKEVDPFEIEDQAKNEHDKLMQFTHQYPEENSDNIGIFFATLKEAWKKPLIHVIEKYRDHDRFMQDFSKWKVKHGKG